MNTAAALPDGVVVALGWTLVHFLWQGTLVAGMLALVQKALEHSGANARYAAACSALALMLALPAGTFLHLRATLGADAVAASGAASSTLAGTTHRGLPEGPQAGAAGSRPARDDRRGSLSAADLEGAALRAVNGRSYVIRNDGLESIPSREGAAKGPVRAGELGQRELSTSRGSEGGVRLPRAVTLAEKPAAEPSVLARTVSTANALARAGFALSMALATLAALAQGWIMERLVHGLPLLVGAWAVGVLLLTVRLVGGWIVVQRIKHRVIASPMDALQDRFDELRRRVGVSQPVRICKSLLVEVPTVIGWLRPVVLVPASALVGLSPRQLEALLAHELAHIRRHDYVVNLIQTLGETVLFYHPAVWWVSARIRDEREHACDDVAVQVCGDRVAYARALWELERTRSVSLDLALAANGGSLLHRVRRLLVPAPKASHTSRWAAGAIMMGALLVVLVGAGPLLNAREASSRGDVRQGAFEYASADQTARFAHAAPSAPRVRAPEAPASSRPAPHVGPVPTPRVAPAPAHPDMAPVPAPPAAPRVAPAPGATPVPAARVAPAPRAPGRRDARWVERTPDALPKPPANPWAACRMPETASLAPQLIPVPAHDAGADTHYSYTYRYASDVDVQEDDCGQDHHEGHADMGAVELSLTDMEHRLEHLSIDLTDVANIQVDLGQAPHEGMAGLDAAVAALAGISVDLDDFDFGVLDVDDRDLQDLRFQDIRLEGFDDDEIEDIRRLFQYLSINGVTPRYVAGLVQAGMDDPSAAEVVLLRRTGVTRGYVRGMSRVGLADLGASELIAMRQHQVTPSLVQATREAFGEGHLDAGEVVGLQMHGITPEYIRAMRATGLEFEADELLSLRIQGILPEYVREVMKADGDVDVDDVITLHMHGMNADWIQSMRGVGNGDPDLDDLEMLQRNGVSPEYVRSMRDLGFEGLGAEELTTLHRQGVTAEWAAGLQWLGYDVDESSLVELRSHGISLGFAAQMRQIGYRDLTLDQLLELKVQGVTPEYIASLRVLGYEAVDEVVAFRRNDVTPELVAVYNAAMRRTLDSGELIRLRQHAVRAFYAAAMMSAAPDLSLQELINLHNHGVRADYLTAMDAIKGRDLGIDDVIHLFDHGVRSAFVRGLALEGRDEMSIQDVIRLQDHGVGLKFIRKVHRAGYEDASVDQIIDWFHTELPAPSESG